MVVIPLLWTAEVSSRSCSLSIAGWLLAEAYLNGNEGGEERGRREGERERGEERGRTSSFQSR